MFLTGRVRLKQKRYRDTGPFLAHISIINLVKKALNEMEAYASHLSNFTGLEKNVVKKIIVATDPMRGFFLSIPCWLE